jgi:hypothetical protein
LSNKIDHEIAELRAVMQQKIDGTVHVIGEGISELIGEKLRLSESRTAATLTELRTDIATKIGEVRGETIGRIAALDPATVRSKVDQPFRFAGVPEAEPRDSTTRHPAIIGGDVH